MNLRFLSFRHLRLASLVVILAMLLASLAPVALAQSSAPTVIVSPEVVHTGTAPTGYEVTFRYYDPAATRVRFRGEIGLRTTASSTLHPPTLYQPGDFYGGQYTYDMVLDAATGVWSYTTPLPPGTWSYSFIPTPCTGCQSQIPDPLNQPFNMHGATWDGSYPRWSEVYVPQDAAFSPEDRSLEAPAPAEQRGALTIRRYPSPGATNCTRIVDCVSPANEHDITVYTPAGYDPARAVPYPTLYLSHGAGGSEVDWPSQGSAGNIIDNLIARGQIQPLVMVVTNFNNIPNSTAGYRNDVLNNVMPFVEANYNISHNASDRAFGGLSMGGMRANDMLFNATTSWGYIASWSIGSMGAPSISSPLWNNPDLKTRFALHLGGGIFDSITFPGLNTYEANLTAKGIPFVDDRVNGIHSWEVWRKMVADFAGTLAFKHTTTTLTRAVPGTDQRGLFVFKVTVKADTAEPALLTGTVTFYLDGQKLDPVRPVRDGDGAFTLLIARVRLSPGPHTVTAVYSGDNFYNTSTSATVQVTP